MAWIESWPSPKCGQGRVRIRKTYNNFSRVVLRGIGDGSLIDDKHISSQPLIVCPTITLGEFALVVREEKDIVSSNIVGLPPGSHHVGIIEGYHSNDIYAFFLQYANIFDVGRKVSFGAAGSESAFKLIY